MKIYSPNITGSLYVTGSNNVITGSLTVTQGITGSLFGTASYALSSNSASFAATSSYTTAISGTTYYLSKFLTGGTVGNSLIYDDGTNVGIGLTSSTSRLEINPLENQTALKVSNYSLTGSNNQSALDISGTWNTSGTPTLIKANLTDTTSNANSFLIDLQVGGSSQFRVRKDGYARASAGFVIGTSNSNDLVSSNGGESAAANGLFTSLRFGGSSTDGYGLTISGFNTQTRTNTTGVAGVLQLAHGFAPTSGTGTFIGLRYGGTINQTGGANGITRGLYITPTLTSAADWRAIETTNGRWILTDTYSAGSGSLANPSLDINTTWNTTGVPTLIRANVTNTASTGVGLLIDLRLNNSTLFSLDRFGQINNSIITTAVGGVSAPTISGLNISGTEISTSGTGGGVRVNRSLFTSTGTGVFNGFSFVGTINQTGDANGITRGLYINPTLTSAADWRSIENTIGNNLLNSTSGNTYIGLPTNTGTAKLHVRGSGATSTTTALRVENSTPTTLLTIQDNGQFTYNTPTMSLETTSSAYNINLNVSQSALVGAQVYGVNLTPTFFATTGSQTQTALRVNAVFTGSAAATSGSNIIADFGSTSAGSQLTVTDVTSGSIYMVNDVSGLPIIEATSDWTVNMYDFPNRVFRKTGSVLELGVQNNTGSAVNLFADTILNEGLGFTYRTAQASGSTVGAVTSSIWNINFSSVSSSVYVNATVTGFDTGSRDTITGDIKATIRYRAGVATIIGTNQTFINSDNAGVSFNIVAGGTSGSLQVYGSDSTTYQWGATVITQVI